MNNSNNTPKITLGSVILLIIAAVVTAAGLIAVVTWDSGGAINFGLFVANYELEEAVAVLVVGIVLLAIAVASIFMRNKKQ
ncbi:MAG: hypothetical protein LUC38_06180 [Oscillospiraceae bacterium]|nr:hypothetical protein [Ruminococcus sp.]MCD8345532.1 hypothetical protein [Oscillospiraceae bacterium]